MSCLSPLFSRVIYSVGNELLIVSLASYSSSQQCLQSRPTSHETLEGATPTKNAWRDSEVWLFYLLISRYYAHRIVTCVKQNNVIICLYDLMLHTLINKIVNVNIME